MKACYLQLSVETSCTEPSMLSSHTLEEYKLSSLPMRGWFRAAGCGFWLEWTGSIIKHFWEPDFCWGFCWVPGLYRHIRCSPCPQSWSCLWCHADGGRQPQRKCLILGDTIMNKDIFLSWVHHPPLPTVRPHAWVLNRSPTSSKEPLCLK